ncbi:MAG: hypothetical protein ACJ74O_01095 [Frankiaceae bacterium]
MTEIRLRPAGEHDYGVTVIEGDIATDHKVRVTEDFLDALAVPDADEEQVVRESIGFLLERKKSTELYEEFELDTIVDQYPDDYLNELRTRLS